MSLSEIFPRLHHQTFHVPKIVESSAMVSAAWMDTAYVRENSATSQLSHLSK